MDLDLPLRLLAERQHGVIARVQARDLGATRHHLRRRAESTEWEAITRGSSAWWVPSGRSASERAMAATLDAGPGAAISHESAGALWRLPGFPADAVHVSRAVGRSAHHSPLATLHRTCSLPEAHVYRVEGIPATSPARTIFDLAGVLHPGRTERALDNALARRLTTVASLRQVTDALAAGPARQLAHAPAPRGPGRRLRPAGEQPRGSVACCRQAGRTRHARAPAGRRR